MNVSANEPPALLVPEIERFAAFKSAADLLCVEERRDGVPTHWLRGYRLLAVEQWLADARRVLWCVLERTGRDDDAVLVGRFSQALDSSAEQCARWTALCAAEYVVFALIKLSAQYRTIVVGVCRVWRRGVDRR